MKYAMLLVLVVSAACGGSSAPPPSSKPAVTPSAAPKRDKEFDDLLKRADEAVPKDAPDNQPLPPPDTNQVVIVPGARTTSSYNPATGIVTRRTPAGTTTYYPQYDRPQQPEKSEMDKMREKAQRTFFYRIQSLAQQQFSLDSLRGQQRFACSGSKNVTATGNTVYNPNAPRSATSAAAGAGTYVVDNAASPECRSLTGSLAAQEGNVRRVRDQIDIEAKQMDIYPGVMRELYAKAGIDR
jgi:hypothetical protein